MARVQQIGAMLGGAALLAAAAFLLLRDDRTNPRVDAPAPAVARNPEAALAETIDRSSSPTLPAAVPPAEREIAAAPVAAAHARLSGRVLIRDEDLPVAGVRVSAETMSENGEEPSVLTDADGRYVLDFSSSVDLRHVLVDAGPATTAVRIWFGEGLVPPAQRTLELEVTRGAQVSGRVLDESGAPVVDALVRSYDDSALDIDAHSRPQRETRTDTFGRYSLPSVGAPATILASAPGRTCALANGGSPIPGRSYDDVDLRLVVAQQVVGLVVDEGGTAVAEATLAFQPHMSVRNDDGFTAFEPWPWPTTTNGAGQFTFDVPPESTVVAEFELQADHPDFAPWSGQLPTGDLATIVLARGAELTGLVLDESGKPVAGARLRAVSRLEIETATSDHDGSYRFTGLAPESSVALLVHGRGYAIQIDEDISLLAGSATRHDVTLQAGRVLAGRVSDSSGQPVPGAHVEIEGDRQRQLEARVSPAPTWERWLGLAESVADEQGRFRIEDLYDGAFQVTAFAADDKGTQAAVSTRTTDEHVELVLPDAAVARIHLVGRITDSRSGAPIERASFTFMVQHKDDDGWGGPIQDVSAPDGRYDILGPMAGTYQLNVTADDHAGFADAPRAFPGGVERLDISLDPLRSLRVQVVRADGSPVPQASVSFRGDDGSLLWVNTEEGLAGGAITDDRGEVQVSGVPARIVGIDVRLSSDVAHESFDLRDSRLQTARIVLGVQAVRTVDVALCLSRETIAADIDRDGFRALLDAGRARPYVGPAALNARDAGGAVVARATAQVVGQEIRVDTQDSQGASHRTGPAVFTEFLLSVPASALTLELEVPGHAPWRSEVAAGLQPVRQLAVLSDG